MTDEPRHPGRLAGPITLVLLILLGLLAIHSIEPPAAVDANAPARGILRGARDARRARDRKSAAPARFSRKRSRARLPRRAIAGTRRDSRSADCDRRAAYSFWPGHLGRREQLVAKIPGTNPTGAVLMVAHYDSAPSGPGAGDDAASVAAIIEAIRALKTEPAARNDLIVLFTDGEELGLLGAKGFVETQPALSNIKVVLNFEMRGDHGPSMMFQTSVATFVARGQQSADFAVAVLLPKPLAWVPRHDLTCFSRRRNRWDEFCCSRRNHCAITPSSTTPICSTSARCKVRDRSRCRWLAAFGSIDLNALANRKRSLLRREMIR